MEPPVLQVADEPPATAYPDELLEHALVKLLEHEVELLPVVSRDDPTRVVGYVERSGIMAAWVAATRAEGMREEGWLTGHLQALLERVKQALTGAR